MSKDPGWNYDPAKGGIKHDQGKRRWTLLPFKALEGVVQVLEYGEGKYGKDQWKKGMPEERLIDAAMRHMTSHLDGEILDPESGLPHLDHAVTNLLFVNYFRAKGMVKHA